MHFRRLFEDQPKFSRLYQDSLIDERGLAVTLIDKVAGKRLEVFFRYYFQYRKTDESYALVTGAQLNHTPVEHHWCYEVTNSPLLEELHFQTHGIYRDRHLHHVLLVTSDELIDVLCEDLPDVSVTDLKGSGSKAAADFDGR